MSTAEQSTWLTQEAYDRLATELEQLVTVARHEIAKKIQEAREEGDLKENGGYHAAKEEQGRIESRIDRIENILATATVGEAPKSHGIVEQGVVVAAGGQHLGDQLHLFLGRRRGDLLAGGFVGEGHHGGEHHGEGHHDGAGAGGQAEGSLLMA